VRRPGVGAHGASLGDAGIGGPVQAHSEARRREVAHHDNGRRTSHGQRRPSQQTWQDLPRYVWRHSPQEEEAEEEGRRGGEGSEGGRAVRALWVAGIVLLGAAPVAAQQDDRWRSEEHTSELQSPYDLVCRLLLEKKK